MPTSQAKHRQNQEIEAKAGSKPVIRIIGGQLPEQVEQAEQALVAYDHQVYQRSGFLVRVLTNSLPPKGIKRSENALVIHTVEAPYLVKRFTEAALWVRYDARRQSWKQVDCPKVIAETYLACAPWKVPVLTGILEAPTLRPDGSILETPGYDKDTGLLFCPGEITFPPIPQNPTQEDAIKAVEIFRKILCGFPFVSDTDFAVAMSAILTGLIRRSLRTAPLHGYSAPKMGSGKSLLADVTAMIATGRPAAVMSQSDSPEEEKKRLLAVLMEGDPVVCIDNIERPLGSDSICSILTQESWKERLLGKNKTVTVPTNISFLATGNNLAFQGDLSTRALICMLDPQCERPEERKFDVNLYRYVPEHRTQLVQAGLTILRAYHVAGRPKQNIPTFGRFEEWSDWVRSTLLWVGLADPSESRKRIEDTDPVRTNIRALLSNWQACIQGSVTVKEFIQTAKQPGNETLYDALTEFIEEKHGEINQRQLGKKLKSIQGRIEGGMRLEEFGKRQNFILWRVRVINKI
jgi:hypothetical protein